jgi:hypothetical protein
VVYAEEDFSSSVPLPSADQVSTGDSASVLKQELVTAPNVMPPLL